MKNIEPFIKIQEKGGGWFRLKYSAIECLIPHLSDDRTVVLLSGGHEVIINLSSWHIESIIDEELKKHGYKNDS